MAGLPSGENQDAFLPLGGEGTMTCGPVREAVGVCHDEPSLGAAVGDLLSSGFDTADVSVSLSLDRHHVEYVRQRLVFGGLRLWLHAADRDRETRACQVLKCQAAQPVAWSS